MSIMIWSNYYIIKEEKKMGNKPPTPKTIKQDYFNLINNNINQSITSNANNAINTSICLDKKDFENSVVSLKIKVRKHQKPVNWKSYLLQYLKSEGKQGIIWALCLQLSMTSMEFANEKQWQNNFLYQEYKILTEPKCLLRYEHDHTAKELSTNSESGYRFQSNFMGSFLSTATFDSDTSGSQMSLLDYKQKKQLIKQYVKYFKLHIFSDNHPIKLIVKQFVKHFNDDIRALIQQIRGYDLNQKEKEDRLNMVIEQLQRFIVEMQVVLKLFYASTISYKYFIEGKDEFINLITSLLFSCDSLYEQLYSLYEIVLRDDIDRMRNQLKRLENTVPEDLGIHTQFCLNNSTKTFQEKLMKSLNTKREEKVTHFHNEECNEHAYTQKEPININTKSKIPKKLDSRPKSSCHNLLKDDSIGTLNNSLTIKAESQKINIFRRSKGKSANRRNDNAQPFKNSIHLLRTLASCRVPFEKMMIIATISNEITRDVDLYWKEMENVITIPSLLSIDPDQLMTLYIYIIIKAKIPELIIHAELVEKFTTPMTRSAMIGYYFTTLKGSLNYILEIQEKGEAKHNMNEEEEF